MRELSQTWKRRAACRDDGTEPYFPTRELSSRSTPNDYRDARHRCTTCPVATACLAASLRRPERYGLWGGLAPRERAELERSLHASMIERLRRGDLTDADWDRLRAEQARRWSRVHTAA